MQGVRMTKKDLNQFRNANKCSVHNSFELPFVQKINADTNASKILPINQSKTAPLSLTLTHLCPARDRSNRAVPSA
jgi:hypothetical protein